MEKIKYLLKQILPDFVYNIYKKNIRGGVEHAKMLTDPFEIKQDIMQKYFGNGYSQYGQDVFLWNYVFGFKRNGFFADVGGNHPIRRNNTYFYEKLGWKGIAFEPQKSFHELWKNERSTKCIWKAVGAFDGKIAFEESESSELSSVKGYGEQKKISRRTIIPQTTLRSAFDLEKITQIDYLSIDVEGYELEVLKGIDFKKVDIYCIDIENNKGKHGSASKEIRNYLINRGYRLIGRLCIDDIFVRENED